MSASNSSLKFSDLSSSDEDISFPDNLYENIMFYLIFQEPDIFKMDVKTTGKIYRNFDSIEPDYLNHLQCL